jgi:hypothetical protein
MIFEEKEVIKVASTDGTLVDSKADGCWVLV